MGLRTVQPVPATQHRVWIQGVVGKNKADAPKEFITLSRFVP
jgi:hypothetical protein